MEAVMKNISINQLDYENSVDCLRGIRTQSCSRWMIVVADESTELLSLNCTPHIYFPQRVSSLW